LGQIGQIAETRRMCYHSCMSIAHSIASKARWADVPKQERTRRMSELARRRHAALGTEERRANAMRMVEGHRGLKGKGKRGMI